MYFLNRRNFLAGLTCVLTAPAKAIEPNYGFKELQPRTYDDGLIPRYSFELIELSLGGRLGAYVLDLETGRSSAWSSTAEFDARPVAGIFLIAAAQWSVAKGTLKWSDRFSGRCFKGSPHTMRQVSVYDLCSEIAANAESAATPTLHRILAGQSMLDGFRDHLSGSENHQAVKSTPDVHCTGDFSFVSTPERMMQSLEYILSEAHQPSIPVGLLRENSEPPSSGGSGLSAGIPASWPVFEQSAIRSDGQSASLAVIQAPARAPLLMIVFISGSVQTAQGLIEHHAELARIATTNLLLPSLDPYLDE